MVVAALVAHKSRNWLCEEIEAVVFEDRLGCLRAQERQILGRIGLGGCRQRHGIDDRIVGIVGKDADNFHSRFYLRVCLIDDAERRFAACDHTKGRANIFGHGHFWLDCCPCAEPFQRSLGIKPDRNFAYIACCYTAVSSKLGKIKVRSDCELVNLGILGSDQYQLIAQQIDARVNFLAHAVVHPLQVSGGEYVHWRALLDLLSQRRTCSIADDDLDTTLLRKSCINIIECVRKRGGGKHRDGFVFRMSGCYSNREEPPHCQTTKASATTPKIVSEARRFPASAPLTF